MSKCRGSDEIGSDYTAERATEDSAYESGHRDGYADARSDMTVDPVADVYELFKAELDKIAAVVGECLRAVKRAQMAFDAAGERGGDSPAEPK